MMVIGLEYLQYRIAFKCLGGFTGIIKSTLNGRLVNSFVKKSMVNHLWNSRYSIAHNN